MIRLWPLVASVLPMLPLGACGSTKEPPRDVRFGTAASMREHASGLGCVMVPVERQYFSDIGFECRKTIRRAPCCSVSLRLDASSDRADGSRSEILNARLSILGCDDEEAISYGVSLLAPLLTEDERDTLNGFVRRPRVAPERLEAEEIEIEQTRMIGALHVTAGFQGGVTAAGMPQRHVTLDRYTPTGVREVRQPALPRHWLLDSQACPAGT